MKKYYPSAKSISLGFFLWGILFLSFGFAFYMMFKHASMQELIMLSCILIAVLLFVGIVWFRTGYFISKDYLIVKIGSVTHSKIKISSISKISRSNSILSSPANSFRRLAIKSGQKVLVQISPRDEESFLTLMTEINPKIDIDL